MQKKAKKTILTVCNDAGGAEIISSFVRKNRRQYCFHCVTRGPAAEIFQRKNLSDLAIKFDENDNPARVFETIGKINLLLAGTGWSADLELRFIEEAKQREIKTAAYLDHWVNYRERFGSPARGWQKNLPDEIWVGDTDAFLLAKRKFTIPVKLAANEFFNDIKREWREYKKIKPPRKTILFASEPIDAMRSKGKSRQEYAILEKIINLLIKDFPCARLIIRLHPSEPLDKYRELIEKYGQNLQIGVHFFKTNMLDDLARAGSVIGMKSMFLVVAALCGKSAASFLPAGAGKCPLLEKRIIKIKNIKELKKWLIRAGFS